MILSGNTITVVVVLQTFLVGIRRVEIDRVYKRRNWRFVTSLDGRGDACSVIICMLGGGLRFWFEGLRVNLGKRFYRLALRHSGEDLE